MKGIHEKLIQKECMIENNHHKFYCKPDDSKEGRMLFVVVVMRVKKDNGHRGRNNCFIRKEWFALRIFLL